jgi:hypothetical protein
MLWERCRRGELVAVVWGGINVGTTTFHWRQNWTEQRRQKNRSMNQRPVVVLAGWLGCHPRNLRRFVQLYDRLGWDSLVRIAPPESVITATASGPSFKMSGGGDDSHTSSVNTVRPSDASKNIIMERLANDTLQELQSRQTPHFIVHVFSNGGCFLYEWMRYILTTKQSSPQHSNIDAHDLKQKLIGLVFDSAPAYYGERTDGLEAALQFVSPAEERDRLIGLARALDPNDVKCRHHQFWTNQSNDATMVPQLYLYSRKDHLTSYKPLEKLIDDKQVLLGGERTVWKHDFVDSDHVGHLLKYPDEYERITAQFTGFCVNRSESTKNNFTMSKL